MEKIKQLLESKEGKDVLVVLIVILVGFGSFGLGRLSKGGQGAGIRIEYTEASHQAASAASAFISEENLPKVSDVAINLAGKSFFASSRGTKYYPAGCSAGKSLKLENRVYFATREDAEKAGYTLSSSCK